MILALHVLWAQANNEKEMSKRPSRYRRAVNSLFRRFNWRCQICNKPLSPSLMGKRGHNDPDAPTIDHIVPRSKGGRRGTSNQQAACRACNEYKGDTMP